MRELAGRLAALDPAASETLRVIAYFDRLVDGRVGAEGMLRGAAVLSGAPVGRLTAGRAEGRRFGADGAALADGGPGDWPGVAIGDGDVVWLERAGEPHANDAMILERLAISLSVLSQRLDTAAPTRRAVEVLLLGDSTEAARQEAADRLGLALHAAVRAVAVPAVMRVTRPAAQAVVGSRFGVVRAVITTLDDPATAERAGVGVPARTPEEVRQSWRSALVALRLAEEERPVVWAESLGPLLGLAEAEDQRAAPHPDVAALDRALATHWSEPLLRDLAAGASRRALAARAGVHHSTMGARVHELPALLGFDPLTPLGRTRLDVALLLHRLASTRFDGEG
ncbi:hypothetical protein [Herbiconiux sp. A18JL235]|uniref:PucR C-terminal helix-turn-helix domain-containing protein n=1 Tax=Herbiconiux sp. A18JL235 TaxID=3152363 RepID=A0AB39BKU4_9MICO